MLTVQKAIFPGIALGCLFLVMFTRLIANPQVSSMSGIGVVPVEAQVPGQEGAAALPSPEEQVETVGQYLEDLLLEGDGAAGQPAAEAVAIGAEVEQATEPLAAEAPAAEDQPASDEEIPFADLPAVELPDGPYCNVSSSYPESILQWCELIDRYATENGLDSNLIAAVMLQESGGNAQAYSKSGAVGLMQVMPRDGLAAGFMCVNGPCFASRPSMQELYDPEFNISYGARMLAGLVAKKGSVREALRAYGPMNIGYHYADLVISIFEQHH